MNATETTETTYPYPCPSWCDCPMDERFAPFHFWAEWQDGTTAGDPIAAAGDTGIVQVDRLADGVVVAGVPAINVYVGGNMAGAVDAATARALTANLIASA